MTNYSNPVKVSLDNKVQYANYPSADNYSLTDQQFTNRLNQVHRVNTENFEQKSHLTYSMLRLFGIVGTIALLGGIATVVIKEKGKKDVQKMKGDSQLEVEEKRHQNQLIKIKAEEESKIRVANAKEELRRYREKEKSHLVSEDPDSWARPCDKYIAIYNHKSKLACETRYNEALFVPQKQICGDLIQTNDIVLLCGGSGIGKSQLAMNINHGVAEGKVIEAFPFKGKPLQMPTIYVSSERMKDSFQQRFHGYQPKNLHYFDAQRFGTVEDCLDFICEQMDAINGDSMFTFDHVTSLFGEPMNHSRVDFLIKILGVMQDELAKQNKTLTFLFLLHPTKDGEEKESFRSSQVSGSVNWLRLVDTTIAMTASSSKPRIRYLQFKKNRNTRDKRNLKYVIELQKHPVLHFKYVKTLGNANGGKGGKVYRNEKEQLEKWYQKGYTVAEIARKMDRDPKTIRKHICGQ